jgi:glycerophosphoryl diester phosphodiesterase
MLNHPIVIAHRGYSSDYPENSLQAFQAAIVAGADAIELDIRFSADGFPIVFHDSDFSRFGLNAGNVSGLNLTNIKNLTLNQKDQSFEVPELAEVAQVIPGNVTLLVEIKPDVTTINELALRKICETMATLNIAWKALCYDPVVLSMFKSIDKHICTVLNSDRPFSAGEIAELKNSGVDELSFYFPVVTEKLTQAVSENNMEYYVFTINTTKDLAMISNVSPNGIMSDNPQWLKRALGKNEEK